LCLYITTKINKHMAKTIEFTVKTPGTFTSYLKKFISIDKSVLFELDLENSRFITKSPNEERSIVKYSVLTFDEAGFDIKTKEKIRIKIGIYNISRLIKIIDQFGGEFKMAIKYDEILSNSQTDYAAIAIILSKEDLKFSNECTSLNIFKYISDDLYENTIRKIDEIVSFEFNKDIIEKVRTFCELDKDYKLLEFITKNDNLYIKGKSFEFLIIKSSNNSIKIPFYKDQFEKVDLENYKLTVGTDRMLFTSLDTTSEILISKVEVNEKYEETFIDHF
jgi:hypothetical protein